MNCLNRPLYPMPGEGCGHCSHRDCPGGESWRMPLFRCEKGPAFDGCGCARQTVRLENPCCPGEYAEIELSVDACGNLVVCVHRDGWNGPCRRPRKRC